MKVIKIISKFLKENNAFAHCDIPCGVYDPYNAQRAAHTVLRMTELLKDIKIEDDLESDHSIARITHVKEDHSNILEEELETLRNDYFKEEHYKKYPELEDLFKKTFQLSSKARQTISVEAAQSTLAHVLEIAEIFFKTKNVEPVRVKSVYPTGGEFVTHK